MIKAFLVATDEIKINTINICVYCSIATTSWAQHHDVNYDTHTAPEKDIKTEIKEFIAHHLQDTHDFHLTKGVSFPLPVILWDNGFQVFSSSKFHHGETVAEHKETFTNYTTERFTKQMRKEPSFMITTIMQ